MNKFKKLGVILLALAGLFMLTSCSAMDELKDKTGYYTENRNSIEWKGRTYVLSKLDISSLEFSFDDYINVCSKEVPLFLSRAYGTAYSTDREQKVLYRSYDIIGSMDDPFGGESFGVPADEEFDSRIPSPPRLYIREDCVEEITGLFKNAVTDHYCMQGWTGKDYGSVLITDEKQKLLDDALNDPKNRLSDEEMEDAKELLFGTVFDTLMIRRCDKTMLVQKDSITVYVVEGVKGNRFCLIEVTTDTDDIWYMLPDDSLYNELSKQIYPQNDMKEGV